MRVVFVHSCVHFLFLNYLIPRVNVWTVSAWSTADTFGLHGLYENISALWGVIFKIYHIVLVDSQIRCTNYVVATLNQR